jgi:hypothetical protein
MWKQQERLTQEDVSARNIDSNQVDVAFEPEESGRNENGEVYQQCYYCHSEHLSSVIGVIVGSLAVASLSITPLEIPLFS